MNCSEFRNWLEDVETAHDTGAGRLHVDQCGDAACRSLWEEHSLVEDAIGAWKRSVPATDVADRVWAQLNAPSRAAAVSAPTKRTSGRSWLALTLTAGVVAVSLWGLSVLNRPEGNNPGSGVADGPPAVVPQDDPPLQRYSTAPVDLAMNASAFVADAALLTVRDVGDPDDPSRPVSAWATRVSRQLQPLGENFNKAVEYLDEVIPDMPAMEMIPTS